jgi:Tol biopolymer transport system component
MARQLDGANGELRGDSRPVVDGVTPGFNLGMFSSSSNGILVYRPGNIISDGQMHWFDRSGKQIGILGGTASYTNPALSPDGKRLAVCIREPGANRDIWIFDVDRGTSSKLTFDPSDDINPVWSPDGSRVLFSSDRKGKRDLYIKNSSGTREEQLLFESDLTKNAEDWSRDGRYLLFNQVVPRASNDIWTWSFDTHQARPFVQTPFNEEQARFSPDGQWIAYRSMESGRFEVHIQPYMGSGPPGKLVISSGGGTEPQWRADGKELFYATPGSPTRLMAVDVSYKDGAIVIGTPHVLFETRISVGGRNRWVVTPDGKKFLVIVPLEQKPVTSLNVILNWPSLLAK